MSESEGDSGPGQREVAYRLFAAEFDDSDFSYSESDEERAPNYVITPTGARANRVFVVGVLTEVEEVGEDVLRARVVDPTGAFVLYAGQYQPDEMAFLDRAETPSFVAVTGKARTFQPEDSDAVYTSIRPESISTVDAATRDRWTVQTAEQTLDRIERMATALALGASGDALTEALLERGASESLAAGIPLAIDHYDTSPNYLAALRETALDAARVVSGDIDEVAAPSVAPDAPGSTELGELTDTAVAAGAGEDGDSTAETAKAQESTAASEPTAESGSGTVADSESEPIETEAATDAAESESPAEPEPELSTEPEVTESEPEPEPTEPDTGSVETESATAGSSTGADTEAVSEPLDTDDSAAESDDVGDFEPGEFDLDEDEREEIEAEFGTEFQSGTDVPEPGESDIDTPDPEELAEADAETAADAEAAAETAAPAASETEAQSEPATEPKSERAKASDESTADAEAEEAAEDVDIEDVVIDVMEELDAGEGVDRSDLVEAVTDRYGVSEADVEEAIQDALMSGRCYEPDDTTLKSI